MRRGVAFAARAGSSRVAVTDIAITTKEAPSAQERETIIGGLVGYNRTQAGPAHHRQLTVLSHQADELVGGLLGFTNWNWVFITQLWVAETVRGSGVGRRLIQACEHEAVTRGCSHAHTDTFGFQALPFYQKLGYEVFGELEDYPPGHTRYFLQKRNLSGE